MTLSPLSTEAMKNPPPSALQSVTEKIVKAVPEIQNAEHNEWDASDLYPTCERCGNGSHNSVNLDYGPCCRPITLEDVLRAMAKKHSDRLTNASVAMVMPEVLVDKEGRFWGVYFIGSAKPRLYCRWHLGLPLHLQKPEVWEWLHALLCE